MRSLRVPALSAFERVPLPALARTVVAVLLIATHAVAPAYAQQVFTGDPVNPGTGTPYPVMPGVPLLLPGDDEDFGTVDDVVDDGIEGDVDLVVRSGNVTGPVIPPPSLASGGAPVATVEAGGGSTGVGSELPFTVLVSDGAGSPPYGNVVTSSDMDLRPVTVYAFADLDGDGAIGPRNDDGSADNAFELQEATAYAGRQMGAFEAGRFTDAVGLEIAAPASIGGLSVALVAAAWTGSDPQELFSDGPLLLTRWPFMPPLDPKDVIGGGNPPEPDPELPSELEWDIERNYLPAPGHPVLGTPFALRVDGSEPTTDQVHVVSGDAVSARVFVEPAAGDFLARSSPGLRVAPADGSSGRALVLPVERVALASDGALTTLALRVLPTDLFANVADPGSPLIVTVSVSGAAVIASPDDDLDARTETLSLAAAAGTTIVLDDDGTGSAKLELSIGGAPVQVVMVSVGADSDSDADGNADDGNDSGTAGDRPCDASAGSCDDNCPLVINPSQLDSDHDGLGDCCDGTCVQDPVGPTCDECALPATPEVGSLSRAKVSLRFGGGGEADKLTVKLSLVLSPSATLALDSETVSVALTQDGAAGYAAAMAGLFVDTTGTQTSFRYDDPTASVDGVTKAQVRRRSGVWKLSLRAAGVSLAEMAGGAAAVAVTLGDDVASGTLACNVRGSRVVCGLAP